MQVKLTKSICGAFKMAHFAGETIEVADNLGSEIIERGFGELIEEAVKDEPKETATTKIQSEQAVINESKEKATKRK